MKKAVVRLASLAVTLALFAALAQAQATLLAIGTLDSSRAGKFRDVSGLSNILENGIRANELGGFGSAITWAGGNTFLALPDRGPNAVAFNPDLDDTVAYINRFHTITMDLKPNKGAGLPFTLTPTLAATTLLWSASPLNYGGPVGVSGSGAPALNNSLIHYFTGRSDGFDPAANSGDAFNARFDTEGLRVSNNGFRIYISDEYGPYVYEFDRLSASGCVPSRCPSAAQDRLPAST